MTEYTPTTGEIRAGYVDDGGMAEYYDPINGHSQAKVSGTYFDRWLAAHDAEVAAKALEEAVTWLLHNGGEQAGSVAHAAYDEAIEDPAAWLSERAAAYREHGI